MPPFAPGRRAFTLLELLTVIVIIGVLAALVVPAVGACRNHARQSREVAAARQLMVAYHAYASDNRGILLSGSGGGASATSEGGRLVSGMPAARWPHHLLPYLGERFRATLYVNQQADYYDRLKATQPAASLEYMLSLGTSFGLNSRFLGGDGALILDKPVTRIEQAGVPARLVAFVGARARSLDADCGFFRVDAPCYWSGSGVPEDADSRPADDAAYGYVATRWPGGAVTAFLDGSVGLRRGASLRDMRLWSEAARLADNPSYTPPARP